MKKVVFLIAVFLAATLTGLAQQAPDTNKEEQAIKQAVLDYIEGWYEANTERMERALHPDLAKRYTIRLPTGRDILQSVTAQAMVEFTRAGGGSKTPKEKQHNEVVIGEIDGNLATAKVTSADFVDYLQLAKFNGQWKIVNVLWRPRKERQATPDK